MTKFFLPIIIAFALTACAYPKREKANLAIDDSTEPAAAPRANSAEPARSSSEDEVPKGDIDLGLDGSGGALVVEGALSEKEQEEALAAEEEEDDAEKTTKKGDKKKAEADDDGDE